MGKSNAIKHCLKTDPRFSIVSGRSLKICAMDSVDGPPPNAHLL